MKLVFLVVVLIFAAATVDCRSELDPGINGKPQELYVDRKYENNKASERSTCRARNSCIILGGSCITNGTQCVGRLEPIGCRGANCHCCIPGCPEDKGFFMAPGSKQCFKYVKTPQKNWSDAKSSCVSHGLVLARPYNAGILRQYILERYGDYDNTYIDARGDGSRFVWQRDGQEISNGSPLWYSGHPGSSTSSSYCLTLATHDSWWKSYPNQPYFRQGCTGTEPYLCELIME